MNAVLRMWSLKQIDLGLILSYVTFVSDQISLKLERGRVSRSVVSNSLQPHENAACQASLSMEFSRQAYWSGLPFPSLGDLPEPGLLLCRQILYHLSHQETLILAYFQTGQACSHKLLVGIAWKIMGKCALYTLKDWPALLSAVWSIPLHFSLFNTPLYSLLNATFQLHWVCNSLKIPCYFWCWVCLEY